MTSPTTEQQRQEKTILKDARKRLGWFYRWFNVNWYMDAIPMNAHFQEKCSPRDVDEMDSSSQFMASMTDVLNLVESLQAERDTMLREQREARAALLETRMHYCRFNCDCQPEAPIEKHWVRCREMQKVLSSIPSRPCPQK